jgi:hypothetical protein
MRRGTPRTGHKQLASSWHLFRAYQAPTSGMVGVAAGVGCRATDCWAMRANAAVDADAPSAGEAGEGVGATNALAPLLLPDAALLPGPFTWALSGVEGVPGAGIKALEPVEIADGRGGAAGAWEAAAGTGAGAGTETTARVWCACSSPPSAPPSMRPDRSTGAGGATGGPDPTKTLPPAFPKGPPESGDPAVTKDEGVTEPLGLPNEVTGATESSAPED